MIPPVFTSNQYLKKSPFAVLDYDIRKELERAWENLKERCPLGWLTRGLDQFLSIQSNDDSGTINKREFDNWKLNMQITYLAMLAI